MIALEDLRWVKRAHGTVDERARLHSVLSGLAAPPSTGGGGTPPGIKFFFMRTCT